jgi:hypothetical protein
VEPDEAEASAPSSNAGDSVQQPNSAGFLATDDNAPPPPPLTGVKAGPSKLSTESLGLGNEAPHAFNISDVMHVDMLDDARVTSLSPVAHHIHLGTNSGKIRHSRMYHFLLMDSRIRVHIKL